MINPPLTSQDPLAELRDIATPSAVSWWPLAPGWWLVIALLCALLGYAGWQLWQRYQAGRYLREARALLTEISGQLAAGQPPAALLADTVAVLRRVARQRDELRAANQRSAAEFLAALHHCQPQPALPIDAALLEQTLYADTAAQDTTTADYAAALCSAAERWLAALPVRRPAGGGQ